MNLNPIQMSQKEKFICQALSPYDIRSLIFEKNRLRLTLQSLFKTPTHPTRKFFLVSNERYLFLFFMTVYNE